MLISVIDNKSALIHVRAWHRTGNKPSPGSIMPWPIGTSILNTLRSRQNGCLFPDDIFKGIFFNKNVLIAIKISLKFVPRALVNNNPSLVQKRTWRRTISKPLCEAMMAYFADAYMHRSASMS